MMIDMKIIDFRSFPSTLFTGRKNGNRAKAHFGISNQVFETYILIARHDQVITSSYFLGLLGDSLKSFGGPLEILKHIDLSQISSISRDECEKAIKRGLTTNSGLI